MATKSKSGNDNISARILKAEKNLVPTAYRGKDNFLDVITWNLKWFDALLPNKFKLICKILEELNADILMFQEIKDGSLDGVRDHLVDAGAGSYYLQYGTTGADQRVAFMYDFEWVRLKEKLELFEDEEINQGRKKVFPRLPLLGHFEGLVKGNKKAFEFQLVGVHLKSQMNGGDEQRQKSAKRLAEWLEHEANDVDADVIITGDWNESSDSEVWDPFRSLEQRGDLAFDSINDATEISHLMYKNKNTLGSRLDLNAITMTAYKNVQKDPEVVKWTFLDKMLSATTAKEIQAAITEARDGISDHLPVLTRYYFDVRR